MVLLIIGRYDAVAQGKKRYFTGKPCKRGHYSERRTCSGLCIECTNPKPPDQTVFSNGELMTVRVLIPLGTSDAMKSKIQGLLQPWTDHILKSTV